MLPSGVVLQVRLVSAEAETRHTEVGEINEVLKGLEALFESWEIQMADQRRTQIQKSLRYARTRYVCKYQSRMV